MTARLSASALKAASEQEKDGGNAVRRTKPLSAVVVVVVVVCLLRGGKCKTRPISLSWWLFLDRLLTLYIHNFFFGHFL